MIMSQQEEDTDHMNMIKEGREAALTEAGIRA
jgi:hypothetical protein